MFRTVSIIICLILLCQVKAKASVIQSLPENDPKYLAVRQVYDQVARAFGAVRPPPKLAVVPNRPGVMQVVAVYQPGTDEANLSGPAGANYVRSGISKREGCIAIDERVVDILGELGKSRDDGLALLLGHELTHYYHNHSGLAEFGRGFAGSAEKREAVLAAGVEAATGSAVTATALEKIRLESDRAYIRGKRFEAESEADLFGGFYGYLAGYDTLGVGGRVYDLIYARYPLSSKDLGDYPSLPDRKLLAAKAETRLRELVVAFETANRLLIIGRYREAARLYEYVAKVFPSCEIHNNAGVAWAREALRLAGPDVRYLYPFSLDLESRLKSRGNQTQEWGIYLDRAESCFERARAQNSRYAPAYVNLAAVYQLNGEADLALGFAGKGERLAGNDRTTAAGARIVKGIIFAAAGDSARAAEEFRTAEKMGSALATVNLGLLEGKKPPTKPGPVSPEVSSTLDGQEIGECPETLQDYDPPSLLVEESFDAPEQVIRHKKRGHSESFSVTSEGEPPTTIVIHATGPGYTGSELGITIGSSRDLLLKKMGFPTRVVSSRQGEFLVYEDSFIAYQLDPSGQAVQGWMIYGM